ncbi:ABC transporter permease [soil metagenome]
MLALNRKLLRDLGQMKGQGIAICLVMACGVATFVMSLTTLQSLEKSQSVYYDRYRFAQVFAHVKRAPQSLAAQIAEIPGVQQVQTRIVEDVTLDIPAMPEPAIGRIISVPETGRPELNDLHLREGRYIEAGRGGEVLVSEAFALVHKLQPGDSVSAIINGKFQKLNIVGIVLSPEYVLSISAAGALPDEKRFGVFWMDYRELSSAFDMYQAFNDVTLTLMQGASEPEVLRRVDTLTEPYGGIGAFGREDQLSNRFLTDEIRSLRGMGVIVPIIFLAVAAFLLNVVMTRLISTQREQIAALKAFGYSKFEVGLHYLKFVVVISVIGASIGAFFGVWLAQGMTEMYSKFYKFPSFSFSVNPAVLSGGLFTATGAAILGTLAAVAKAVRLPAAEAMRPEPPASFRPTIVERLGLQRFFTQPARMIMRELERRPFKASMSVLGISMAVAVLVMGRFLDDALDYMITFGFYTQQRQDVTVAFVEPTTLSAFYEIERLPGVLSAEPMRSVPVRLRSGHHMRRVGIIGLPSNAQLMRVIDDSMFPVELPPDGLLLTDKLAEVLEVKPGEKLWVEVMEGERPHLRVPVVGTIKEYAGTNAYMHIDAVRRLMKEDDVLTGASLSVDESKVDELYRTLKETPRVAAVTVKEASVKTFNETQAENQRTLQFFNVIFACIIAGGVVYNTARISLSERSRELATLRVIGFTRREISSILLGELALLTVLALPIGMLLGWCFAYLATLAFNSEMFRIPLVVSRHTYGFAAMVVIIAAIGSGLLVRRRLDHLDLVSVLKSKE